MEEEEKKRLRERGRYRKGKRGEEMRGEEKMKMTREEGREGRARGQEKRAMRGGKDNANIIKRDRHRAAIINHQEWMGR